MISPFYLFKRPILLDKELIFYNW